MQWLLYRLTKIFVRHRTGRTQSRVFLNICRTDRQIEREYSSDDYQQWIHKGWTKNLV